LDLYLTRAKRAFFEEPNKVIKKVYYNKNPGPVQGQEGDIETDIYEADKSEQS
jgi:hypothetical protein